MVIRRIILIVVSTVVGIVSVPALFWTLNTFIDDARVDLNRFGVGYAFLWGFPIALAVAVWLDYLLDTNVLPD